MIDELIALINSDITKTLDKRIEEMKEYLGAYTITASEDEYLTKTFSKAYTKASGVSGDVLKIKLNVSGSVKLIWSYVVSCSTSSDKTKAPMTIYKNGTLLATDSGLSTSDVRVTDTSSTHGVGTTYSTITADVEKGDEFVFHIETSFTNANSTATFSNLSVCGTLEYALTKINVEFISE